MIVCFKKKKISSFYYYSMSSQGKRIVVLDLTAFPFLQTLNKEKTVNYSCKSLFLQDWITLETYIKDSKRKWGDTIDQQFYSQLSSQMPSEESIYTSLFILHLIY